MFEKSKEFVAPKAKTGQEIAIIAAAWVVVLAIVAVIISKVSFVGGISLMIGVVPLYLNKRFTKEFAYTLAGDKLTVELVDYKQKRTPVGNPVFLENLEVCAKVDDSAHNDALKATYAETIEGRTSPKSKTAYFAAFERDGKRTLVYFEPADMLLGEMKKYAEGKIFE